MVTNLNEARTIIENVEKDPFKVDWLNVARREILSFLKKNLSDAKDKEEVFDVSIDAINRMGYELSFIAIFREDRKYSSAVRIRVDSELINRVEDYARKMMPNMTIMMYRIPIHEEGRMFRMFLLEQNKPLVTDNIKIANPGEAITASISDLYENLITKNSPLVLLLPAFKRIVPYKSAMSTHIFTEGTAMGNIGIASGRELTEGDLNMLIVISEMMSQALSRLGFGRNYIL